MLISVCVQDIAFKVVAVAKKPSLTRVSDVMTPNPSCVSVHASAIDALKKMTTGQFRHLPVADNEKGERSTVNLYLNSTVTV